MATLARILFFAIILNLSTAMSTPAPKRILVTGGNKGIGAAICERLLTEWSDTQVILSARSAQKGKEAVESLIQKTKCPADRLEFLEMDVSSDDSVQAAAKTVDKPLYAIINNAGIGFDHSTADTINTNYFGTRRVNDAFGPLLQRPGGRVVNVASASGPYFVAGLSDPTLKETLGKPWTFQGGIPALDKLAKSMNTSDGYGASKALINAYTHLHARSDPDLIINSCTPGFIQTDITANMGASNPPSKGAVPPCWAAMDDSTLPKEPTGRYYGSDCIRSPLHVYRGPGEAPYVSDEDV